VGAAVADRSKGRAFAVAAALAKATAHPVSGVDYPVARIRPATSAPVGVKDVHGRSSNDHAAHQRNGVVKPLTCGHKKPTPKKIGIICVCFNLIGRERLERPGKRKLKKH